MSEEVILNAEKLSKSFGGVNAVNDVSFSLSRGEIVGLIGPNGAGKTTLVNLLSGVITPDRGKITFQGNEVTSQRPYQAARRGIARTFQIVQPFPNMTVLENVMAAVIFASDRTSSLKAARDLALEHLSFVGLAELAEQTAQTLTLPSRKKLELAKSLAMQPKVLMLDEVNAGLNTAEIEKALALIRKISEMGITILIIEHLMKVVLSLSDRILVLHHGELVSQGKPQDVVNDPKVIEAYLGSKFSEKKLFIKDNIHE
jgi:branched-chain amino acid transport system ATP-binding protein